MARYAVAVWLGTLAGGVVFCVISQWGRSSLAIFVLRLIIASSNFAYLAPLRFLRVSEKKSSLPAKPA